MDGVIYKTTNLYGKKQSAESNRKRSETLKGRKRGPQSEEHRRKISEKMKNNARRKF